SLRRTTTFRFLALCLTGASLLAACSDSTTAPGTSDPAPSAQVTPVLTGQLSGAGTAGVDLLSGNTVLASAPTDVAGKFTLTLPSADSLAPVKKSLATGLLTDLGCTGTLTLGDTSAQGFGFGTLSAGGGKTYGDLNVERGAISRTVRGRAYLYADRPTTLSGPLNCQGATGYPTTVQVSVSAAAGWNVLNVRITGGLTLGGIVVNGTAGNGAAAPGSVWTGVEELKAQLR
ncbi:hypothetical protein, partial [Deinococcus sp.]|uniref:hypothetical protein n=1 Tax=Deinococcus sp. TaxID=47478 RepID=UPI0025FC3395